MTTSEGRAGDFEALPGTESLGPAFFGNPAPMAVWRPDRAECVLIGWNRALDELMDHRLSSWLGASASSMFGKVPAYLEALCHAREARQAVRADAWIRMPGRGERRFIEALFSSIDGGLVLTTLMDATAMKLEEERLEAEKAALESALEARLAELGEKIAALEAKETELRSSLERYDALTSHIPFGVFRFRLDAKGEPRVEYVSERMARLTGIPRATSMTEPFAFSESALAVGGEDYLAGVDEAVRARRDFFWEGEAVVRGRVRFLRMEMTAEEPSEGTGLIYNGTVSDITEEREERTRRDKLLAAVDEMSLALEEFRDSARTTSPAAPVAAWGSLSEREAQVAELLLLGLSNRDLAERLFIAESTVKKHIASVFEKLGVSSRAELFRLARR